jgi:hypothetical protein
MTGPLALLYPVLAMMLWTFVLLFWTLQRRTGALRSRRVRMADIALSTDAWPDDVRKVSNNMHNQFETPILFYVLCGAATYIGATGLVMALLAWAYVVTRVIHTSVHVTSNDVQRRFMVFAVGIAVLVAMWALIVVRLLAS